MLTPNKIGIYLTIYLVALMEITTSANSDEKCRYRETVDLTNHTLFANGSYLYHDVIIPDTKVAQYNYRLTFGDKKETAKPHARGCVCNDTSYCITLCCERGQYYNDDKFQCEEIPSDLIMTTEIRNFSVNGDVKKMNIFDYVGYRVEVPCQVPDRWSLDLGPWEMMENGAWYITGELTIRNSLSYCMTPFRRDNDTFDNTFVAMICYPEVKTSWTKFLGLYGVAISVIFLLPTLLVYVFLKDLRKNMRGKLLICYLLSLTVVCSIISYIHISRTYFGLTICSTLGFTGYYFKMASFGWLSVLCYDIWINFKAHSIVTSDKQESIRFVYYSLFAWGTSGILTLVAMWAQFSNAVPELYKPSIGTEICWVDHRKWSAAIYYYCPNLLILVICSITFVRLTLMICRVRRDMDRMTQQNRSFLIENTMIILRIFFITSIADVVNLLGYFLEYYRHYEILYVIQDLRYAFEGLLIFVLFVLKQNVIEALRKTFRRGTTRNPQQNLALLRTLSNPRTNSTINTEL